MENQCGYYTQEGRKFASQREKTHDNEVINSSGGYSFRLEDEKLLECYLILGPPAPSRFKYNIWEASNPLILCVDRMLMHGNGKRVVGVIKKTGNRATHPDWCILSLAYCARCLDDQTKFCAYELLNIVCKTPADLFRFVQICEKFSAGTGWGRMHRKYIAKWYNDKAENDPKHLLYMVTKYNKRNNWSNKDLFRLSHIKPATDDMKFIILYVNRGFEKAKDFSEQANLTDEMLGFLCAYHKIKTCSHNEENILEICLEIRRHQFHFQHVSNQLYKKSSVWGALLPHMTLHTLVRNLGNMTSRGLFENQNVVEIVSEKFKSGNFDKLHPMHVLVALQNYKNGSGIQGCLKWSPNEQIEKLLNDAFKNSFNYVEPSRKSLLIAVDGSDSMKNHHLAKYPWLTAFQGAAALALLFVRIEQFCDIITFSGKKVINLRPNDSLAEVEQKISFHKSRKNLNSYSIIYTMAKSKNIDVFIFITNSDSLDDFKLHEVFQEYKKHINDKACTIVIGMASTGFSAVNPKDNSMLHIAGFDKNTFQVIKNFVSGLEK